MGIYLNPREQAFSVLREKGVQVDHNDAKHFNDFSGKTTLATVSVHYHGIAVGVCDTPQERDYWCNQRGMIEFYIIDTGNIKEFLPSSYRNHLQ